MFIRLCHDADVLFFKDFYAYLEASPGLLDAHIAVQSQCGHLNATHPYFNIGILTFRSSPETMVFVQNWAAVGRNSNYTDWDQSSFQDLWVKNHEADASLYVRAFDDDKVYLMEPLCGPTSPIEDCITKKRCTPQQLQQFVAMHFVVGMKPMAVKVERMQQILADLHSLHDGGLALQLDSLASRGWVSSASCVATD